MLKLINESFIHLRLSFISITQRHIYMYGDIDISHPNNSFGRRSLQRASPVCLEDDRFRDTIFNINVVQFV